jgi:putative peptide zinc metalloprotease protein
VTTIIDAPTRVDDLQLIGAMRGSGYRTPPALVRRGDGQTLQLTPLLYSLLEAVDGRRSCAEIADYVSHAMRRGFTEDMVATLVDQHLRPMGLLKLADGSEPPLKRSNPLLGLKLKFAVTDPRTTRRLTDPFRILFRPALASAVVLGFLAVAWWVFFHHGLGPAAYDAFQRPHLLLLVFVVTVLSGGFHEFGHAAAARYGGADPGVIGAGIYLVWPAFYTDVTDSYRLGRRGRIRTDLGGLYFNAVVVVLTFCWWYATQWDALLLLVATQILQMVQQLLPLLRFDGYHVLADLTGVPDLYQRIRPTLLGLLPHRWSAPESRVLKPWARAVITAWVLITIPMMALMLAALVAAVPRLLGTAWAVVHEDAAGVLDAWATGGVVDIAAHGLQVLAVVLPLLACFMILGRIGLRWSRGLARWSRASIPKRAAAVGLSTVVVTGLSWAWLPQPGTYRPIAPEEKGLLTALLPAADSAVEAAPASWRDPEIRPAVGVARVGASAESRLGGGAPLQATFPKGKALPSKSHPQLAIVLVPREGAHDAPPARPETPREPVEPVEPPEPPGSPGPSQPPGSAEPWVFPFDRPLPPAEGDNQAAAYNTTDDSATYDVAFALVWATGDEVLNVNEAHAYASCTNCVTVAVAFQVVLIMDDARVVVPQNLSVAANYKCYRCITAALASQLVLSVEETPRREQLLSLGEVWDRLTTLGKTITAYSLAEISVRLEAFKAEIVAILGDAPPLLPGTPPVPSPTGTPTDGSSVPSSTTPPSSSPPTPSATSPSSSPSTSPSSSPSTSPDSPPSTSPDSSPSTSPDSPPSTSPDSSPSTSPSSALIQSQTPTTDPTSEPAPETATATPSPEQTSAATTSSPSPSP